MNELYVIMPDILYVGRYYKLYALPKYGPLSNYDYQVSGDCFEMCGANVIRITKPGEITVSASDDTLGSASKTIRCEDIPEPARKKVYYTYTTPEAFKQFVESIVEPTEIIFIRDADIVLDETVDVPRGVLINFNWRNIKIGATLVEKATTFQFNHEHCGVINLKMYSTYPDWSEHTASDKYTQCHTLFRINGAFFRLENFVCTNRQNFSISVGTAVSGSDLTLYSKTYSWNTDNIAIGSIDNAGQIIEDANGYYTPELIALPTVNDRLGVGFFDGFIKGAVKTYAIAFYDDNENFIETRYGQQFFTGYRIPDGATKCRLMLWSDSELTSETGMDWANYLFLFNRYDTENILFKRCRSWDNESGMIDFVGGFDGVNMIACVAKSGKTNSWAIDFEDGWMMMHNVVVKSCSIEMLYIHSVQGIGVLNSCINNHYVNSWANGVFFDTARLVLGVNKSIVDAQKITVPVVYQNCIFDKLTIPTGDQIVTTNCLNTSNDAAQAYAKALWDV